MPTKRASLFLVLSAGAACLLWLGQRSPIQPQAIDTPPAATELAASPLAEQEQGQGPPEPVLQASAPSLPAADEESLRLLQAKFNVGDYHSSLQLAKQHLNNAKTSAAFRQWLTAQLPVLLTSSAWLHIKTGACEQAIPKLEEAAQLKKSPEITSGLGLCYFKAQDWVRAEEELAEYLAQRPADVQARLLLAEIAESQLHYDRAVLALEESVKYSSGPQQEAIKSKLASMRHKQRKSEEHQSGESRHFSLSYPQELGPDLGERLLAFMEASLAELIETYRVRPLAFKIEILLYASADFSQVVNGLPHWAGGVYDGRIRVPLGGWQDSGEQWQRLKTTLRHELVHAVFATLTDHRRLPSWFDEGLADRFAWEANLASGFPMPPTPGEFLPEADFQGPFLAADKVKAEQLYKQSLYLVMMLERKLEGAGLAAIVEGLNPQKSLDSDSLLAPLELSFEALVSKSRSYWQRRDKLRVPD